ncbi:unnamed protein product [Brassicogethes aeneus]|uniref:Uncharacterized protein n=1 Tax=Brassicogethes aeneus TaxID=1431903 RepID=A0A9P0AQL8_BRAAE|nr:unnamed protein product [Brassicogethes aeneus]
MPPKARLHKTTGKPCTLPPKVILNSEPSTSNGISPELEQQFELELCWCIQQLQTALKSGKLKDKQVQDHTKALNTLMSNAAPMVKKRQVMRLSFGDYRAKMSAEEKKLRNINMKVVPGVPSKKSVFLKKSAFSSAGNEFRFDFKEPNESDLVNDLENVKIDNDTKTNDNTRINQKHFVPSGNNFRFNFSVEMEP